MRVAAKVACWVFALGASGSGFAQVAGAAGPELLLFHLPGGAMPTYEVATIKPLDPGSANAMIKLPPGMLISPLSIRRYIMNAYGAVSSPQIVGGPDWLNKDAYQINAKMPEEMAPALQKMNRDDRNKQIHMMQQNLLAERFHLKAHFETRVVPVYELVPVKGGLRITEVPAPPEGKVDDTPVRVRPGVSPTPSPGTFITTMGSDGLNVMNGRAIRTQVFARVIGNQIGDRPVVDHMGFTGCFDVIDMSWATPGDAGASSHPDAPSLTSAIGEKLGIKLVATKAPVEVLVIDSIERPTPN